MKQAALLLSLLLAAAATQAQITYSHYLDHTSQWQMKSVGSFPFGPCGPISGFSNSTRFYMAEEDTLMNGYWYYRLESISHDTIVCPDTFFASVSFGKEFIREDTLHRVHYLQNGTATERMLWNGNMVIGDSIPGCRVASIDTVLLGTMPLKKFNCACGTYIIEGIGSQRSLFDFYCGFGIEGNSFLTCYQKQGDQLQIEPTFPCLLTRVSTSAQTPGLRFTAPYPNPTDGVVHLRNPGGNTLNIDVFNTIGSVITTRRSNGQQISIDISALPLGLYFFATSDGNVQKVFKVVKR